MSVSVVTPSLNKSFKFQSDWPYNNSQVYLLSSIIDDLRADKNCEFQSVDEGYLLKSSVNYPNNKSLVRQNVYVSKNGKIKRVEVVDKDDNVQIVMKFKKEVYDKKFDKDYFELSSLLDMNDNSKNDDKKQDVNDNLSSNQNNQVVEEDKKNENNDGNVNNKEDQSNTQTTTSINDIVYPMYLPNNTYLTNQEKVNTPDGERLILTFGGDSSFVLVEEVNKIYDENMVIPVSGEFDFLTDVIGIIGTHSLSWYSNGIDYYIASDVMETSELIDIARSISVLPVSK